MDGLFERSEATLTETARAARDEWPMALDEWAARAAEELVAMSTRGELRLPIAEAEEQLFLAVARRLEALGVSRKVAADMHGIAVRSYQKKLRRGGRNAPTQTLWTGVLAFLVREGETTREKLVARFRRDDRAVLGAVLFDLRRTGAVTTESDRPDAKIRVTDVGRARATALGLDVRN